MPSQPRRPRTELPFDRDEWDLLVRLPGRVAVAAASVEPDPVRRTVAPGLAGIDAIAAGRASTSRLVREVVSAIYAEPEPTPAAAAAPVDRAVIGEVLADCTRAAAVLVARVEPAQADAYRGWLSSIAARVSQAAYRSRPGAEAGAAGPHRRFTEELAAALGR